MPKKNKKDDAIVTAGGAAAAVATEEAATEPEDERPREVHSLPVILTDEEYKRESEILSEFISQEARLTLEKKQFNKKMTKDIEGVRLEITAQNKIVGSGKKYLPVECAVEFFPKQEKAKIIRLDTGDVVDTRAMTKDERQRNLFKMSEEMKSNIIGFGKLKAVETVSADSNKLVDPNEQDAHDPDNWDNPDDEVEAIGQEIAGQTDLKEASAEVSEELQEIKADPSFDGDNSPEEEIAS